MKNPLAIFRDAGSFIAGFVIGFSIAGLRVLSADRPNCIDVP